MFKNEKVVFGFAVVAILAATGAATIIASENLIAGLCFSFIAALIPIGIARRLSARIADPHYIRLIGYVVAFWFLLGTVYLVREHTGTAWPPLVAFIGGALIGVLVGSRKTTEAISRHIAFPALIAYFAILLVMMSAASPEQLRWLEDQLLWLLIWAAGVGFALLMIRACYLTIRDRLKKG
jgi:hypothetical protein